MEALRRKLKIDKEKAYEAYLQRVEKSTTAKKSLFKSAMDVNRSVRKMATAKKRTVRQAPAVKSSLQTGETVSIKSRKRKQEETVGSSVKKAKMDKSAKTATAIAAKHRSLRSTRANSRQYKRKHAASAGSSVKKAKTDKGEQSEAAVADRRRKACERKRKQRQRIAMDPEAQKIYRAKEQDVYRKRKEDGKVKSVHDLNKAKQARQRRMWRLNSKRYYERKQQASQKQQAGDEIAITNHNKGVSHQRESGKKRARENRTKLYNRCSRLACKLQQSQALVDRWKKRYERLQSKTKGSPSPNKVVRDVMKRGKKDVKRRLLYGEVLQKQLKHNYASCSGQRAKQLHAKVISGTFLNKYKLGFMSRSIVSKHLNRKFREHKVLAYERRERASAIGASGKDDVVAFLEEDINSSVAPGKKDCITKKGVKKQKRYMRDSLHRLHKQYTKSKSTHRHMSYASFCKAKPFWVVKPSVSGRDTCRCVKHANMAFMTDKLHQLKIMAKPASDDDLCARLCCDNTSRTKECMFSECTVCKKKQLPVAVSPERMDEEVFYSQWANTTEDRTDRNKKPITVRVVKKMKISCTARELLQATENQMTAYMRHVFSISHQYRQLRDMRTQLRQNEVLIVIDFSENYLTKYSSEIQSVHFGASRTQITLHTGVMYYSTANGIQCTSFCTLSSSLRHDPGAIWAHLMPVLNLMHVLCPSVDTVNFQSDGPTTQYRNKKNFFLLAYFSSKFGWQHSSWNFSEAGHGKGQPDGIGGVIKQTADQAVAHGSDISSLKDLTKILTDQNINVKMFEIDIEEIEEMDRYLPMNLKAPKNTMKMHQVTWTSNAARSLSFENSPALTVDTTDVSTL